MHGRVVGWKKGAERWISSELSPQQQQRLAGDWVGLADANEKFSGSSQESANAGSPAGGQKKKPASRASVRSGIPRPFPF
jgi:hypothetical protein